MKYLKYHFHIFYTKKVFIFTHALIVLCSLLFLYQSKLHYGPSDFNINYEIFFIEFTYQSIFILKVAIILFVLINTIYSYLFNKTEVTVINQENKMKVYISKLLTMYGITLYFLTVLWFVFMVLKSCVYDDFQVVDITLYLKLILFSTSYLLWFTIMVEWRQNIYVLFIPLIGYITGLMTVDYNVQLSDVSSFSKGYQLLFIDLIYLDESYQFLYSNIIIMSLIIFKSICLLKIYSVKDVI